MSKKLKRRAKAIQRTLEYYALYDNQCQHCGYESFEVGMFDFHHITPEEKSRNVGGMISGHYSHERVLAEIEKCAFLCPNCHRLEHIRLRKEAEMEAIEATDD